MKKRNSIFLLVLIIIVLIIIAYFFVMKSSTTQKGSVNQTIAVQIQKPKVMQLAQNITVVGSIYAPKQTFITPQNNGYITKILFKEGQFVKVITRILPLIDGYECRGEAIQDLNGINIELYRKAREVIC